MYTFKVGKAKLSYEFSDADCVEKIEQELKTFNDRMQAFPQDISFSASIRYFCTTVFDLFNAIFGEGTDKKVFGDVCNMDNCADALVQLISAAQMSDTKNAEKLRAKLEKVMAVK